MSGGSLDIANSIRRNTSAVMLISPMVLFRPCQEPDFTLSDITFMTHAMVLGGRCPFTNSSWALHPRSTPIFSLYSNSRCRTPHRARRFFFSNCIGELSMAHQRGKSHDRAKRNPYMTTLTSFLLLRLSVRFAITRHPKHFLRIFPSRGARVRLMDKRLKRAFMFV